MSQPTHSSSAGFVPIQLSLFVGEFAVTEQAQIDRQGTADSLSDDSLSDDSLSDISLSDISLSDETLRDGLKLAGDEPAVTSNELLCPELIEFMEIFESVSGWEVRFRETAVSKNQRAQNLPSAGQSLRPQGTFEIIDMSVDWPAKTPTMHRGKCDQLLKLYSGLYNQANATQDGLDKAQGLLPALTDSDKGSDQLVDSFVPMYTNLVEDGDQGSDFTLKQGSDFDDEFESAFVVKQEFDSSWLGNQNVWEDWSFGGTTGIVGNVYLDWEQHGDMLTAYVGRIESSFGVGDTESSLEVNAISRQFKVSEENTIAAFFFWDRRGGRLQRVVPDSWRTLHPQGAIIVSTDPNVQMPESVVNAQLGAEPFTADQLATAIEAKLGADHRVLVIKCD